MMKKTGVFVFLAAFSLTLLSWAMVQAEEMKFARVSFMEIQRKSKKINAAFEELQKIQVDGQNKIAAVRGDIARLEAETQKAGVTDAQKAKLEADLNEKRQELQTEEQAVQVKLALKQKSIQSAVGTQIKAIIDKIAKDEGYAAIFRSELLLYAEGLPDLTGKISDALDAAGPLEKE